MGKMKDVIFKGKRKIISIPLLIGFSIIFLPFLIGGLLLFLAIKHIPNKKTKYAVTALIVILTLVFGSTWVNGITKPPNNNSQEARQIQSVESRVAGVQTVSEQTNPTSPPPTSMPTLTVTPTPDVREKAVLVRVVDGDTIEVKINNQLEKVRFIGIDTPETVDPRKPVQCFGKEASEMMTVLMEDKVNDILLEADATQDNRDKYQRLLRYVWTDEGNIDAGKMMVLLGYAKEYTYDLPYKYQSVYKNAEREAQNKKAGLWADDACVAPTSVPTRIPQVEKTQNNIAPAQTNPGGFTCNCSKLCGSMASCEEAYYQLNTCGCSKRDGDSDGVPCETICN